MIDFKNGSTSFSKLKDAANAFNSDVAPILIADENIIASFKGMRDGVVFTNKRIIAINIQGISGKKVDYTSLPYSKIQAFSIETAGLLDIDSEIELWFSGIGKVKFEFATNARVADICKIISTFVLN